MAEEIPPFYDKEIKCPLCESKYTSKKIRSRYTRVKKVHTDFYTEYKDDEYNPYLYEVFVCPSCGYAHTDAFTEQILPANKKLLEDQLKNWNGKDYSGTRTMSEAIDTYKLAIISGNVKQEKNVVLAGLSLRIAWLYRLKESQELEDRFLKMALKQYETSYLNSDYTGSKMSEMKLIYILGELFRRCAQYDKSIRYFSMVVNHKNRALEKNTVNMARDQWHLARDESKQEHEI